MRGHPHDGGVAGEVDAVFAAGLVAHLPDAAGLAALALATRPGGVEGSSE